MFKRNPNTILSVKASLEIWEDYHQGQCPLFAAELCLDLCQKGEAVEEINAKPSDLNHMNYWFEFFGI